MQFLSLISQTSENVGGPIQALGQTDRLFQTFILWTTFKNLLCAKINRYTVEEEMTRQEVHTEHISL
jgi:hypothetical protein